MQKIVFLLVCLLGSTCVLPAQTLFTYGTHAVSKNEFLEAYNKNPDSTGSSEEKMKSYLDLYINFKLKLQAAYDEKVNTNADLKSETENFRSQLADNFINKQANLAGIVHEAFLRSQKDILVQQVFVKFVSPEDTSAAYDQILKAYNELKAGKNFQEISFAYSNVQDVKSVKGNVGYITVFTLPYSIENTLYSLKPGEFSAIYKSITGYHIFKNAGERPAAGRRKIEQLLFSTPSFYSDEQINTVKLLADSVYKQLQAGTSFASLLPAYGHNYQENERDNIIEVKVGDYNTDFEHEVFALKNAGDISRPFKTEYGYNIIKLIQALPVPDNEDNVEFEAYLQTQVQNTGRLDAAKKNLVQRWLTQTGFKEMPYNKPDLWGYTDSNLKTSTLLAAYKAIKPTTVLFEFTKQKFTVKDWLDYLDDHKIHTPRISSDYARMMNDFILISCSDYYRSHIEDYDTSAQEQLKEFNEANMLFYTMDKHVWSKASNDTVGLKKYYEAHKANYMWRQSVTALIISAPEKKLADSVASKIKKDPANWRTIVEPYADVYADSSRFETDELPVKQQVEYKKDFQTIPESNDEGNAYTFIHVLNFHEQLSQKSFEEAKGAVINDYQQELEKAWLSELKIKYPVRINNEVLKTLH